jgi:hypothetical protein
MRWPSSRTRIAASGRGRPADRHHALIGRQVPPLCLSVVCPMTCSTILDYVMQGNPFSGSQEPAPGDQARASAREQKVKIRIIPNERVASRPPRASPDGANITRNRPKGKAARAYSGHVPDVITVNRSPARRNDRENWLWRTSLVTVTTRPSALSCRIYADKSIKIEWNRTSAEGLTGDSRSNPQHYRFSCIASIYAVFTQGQRFPSRPGNRHIRHAHRDHHEMWRQSPKNFIITKISRAHSTRLNAYLIWGAVIIGPDGRAR